MWPSWIIKQDIWNVRVSTVACSAKACLLVLRRICCPVLHRLPCHKQLTICPTFIQLLLPVLVCACVCAHTQCQFILVCFVFWWVVNADTVCGSGTETLDSRAEIVYCVTERTPCLSLNLSPPVKVIFWKGRLSVYKMKWNERRGNLEGNDMNESKLLF